MSLKTSVSVLVLIALLFISFYATAMPIHPDLLARLKQEGKLDAVVEQLQAAREKGVFAPNPRPPKLIGAQTAVNQPAIVILVDFTDNVADTINYPAAHFDSLLFSQGIYPTGSMRDYYLENSYGNMNITGTVTVWLRMPQLYTYYTNDSTGFGTYPRNAQKLTEDAIMAADPFIDFSSFDADGDGYVDALFVVHAGPGAEVTGNPNHIWSHKWQTSVPIPVDGVLASTYSMEPEDGKIGVFSHELGHVFGLPDLYDYGYDSRGLGGWSVMAGGSWGNGGVTPVHFDAWSKTKLGFVTPVEPAAGTLFAVEFPLVEYVPVIYKLYMDNIPNHEYFLVENRRITGFDAYLPGPGLCIYHCDDTVSTGNDLQWYPGYTDSGHYLVALEQADGLWELEQDYGADMGDPYPGTTGNLVFNDTTTPNSSNYSFLSTGVCVDYISPPADTMTANLCAGDPVGIQEQDRELKIENRVLLQNMPNPFYSSTMISYSVLAFSQVSLQVFDISGRFVQTLVDEPQGPGVYQVHWDGKDSSGRGAGNGLYFYHLEAGHFTATRKLILIR
ncbi:M6 family metalloprotease domain-containing protein [candidate division TA06 bacterium]|uniref:M6 family metalloprotease domain-containing protein n=1 Tax=candidate division TA06 bacterium TaxID=2250710 RepID=A0A523UYF8_UNCT6|nr:MAG: M6 family metalloprotease domain-containing protein [candidate division TA06 bacterium]